MGDVVKAILKEIDLKVEDLGNPTVRTIFIGGGTPSSLPNPLLATLLSGIKSYIESSMEVTIEANPESITVDFLETLEKYGVTRLSMGVQSFNDRLLNILGRSCSSYRAKEAIDLVKSKWRGEYSIDLISSIPTQKMEEIKVDIETALEFKPDHISFYSLILEEGTELEDRVSKGVIEELEETLEEDIWLYTRDKLISAGYINYEVSNYYLSKPSLHNLNYWELKPYLGAGPGAASTLINHEGEIVRVENPKSIELYLREKNYGGTTQVVEPSEFLKEYIMMGFRLREGINNKRFKKIFGFNLEKLLPSFNDLGSRGLIEKGSNYIRLTPKGYDLMNSVLTEIFDSLEDIEMDRVNWFY